MTNDTADELARLEALMIYENEAYQRGFRCIVGIDEAGRGPLAGPVLAAACLLPLSYRLPHIDDSKKLLPKLRQKLYQQLVSDPQVKFGLGMCDHLEIDAINIFQATKIAMNRAIENLGIAPDCLLVDGLKLDYPHCESLKIIRGDQLSQSIAAASIIAKETRDAIMLDYHTRWPLYGFGQHKGYATAFHLKAIAEHGPCEIHRKSFEPMKTGF